ncbi:Protein EDS1 [Bienertia sinuspersici]
MNVEGLQRKVESWFKDQTSKLPKFPPLPQLHWAKPKWPPWSTDREQRKKLQEEYEIRKKHLQDLCRDIKAESVSDLQDILCCMVLSECVYKRPASELIRAVNKFKADFGGQVVCLERVQPSLDHVPHRYLLAEAGDTLFASFVGTRVADANIFQGALFHEDNLEVMEEAEVTESDVANGRKGNVESYAKTLETKSKHLKPKWRPAAHRGFMTRAKEIPAWELYKLAQKKKRKLVLCGHSLGGAVAALATLAILRALAVSSPLKDNENVQVKCITFSQPPVGNAALRDYVDQKGWHHYFKTYCIPEDVIPRFLSPAYFDHYNATQTSPIDGSAASSSTDNQGSGMVKVESGKLIMNEGEKLKENGEQLVLGVGPVQTPLWRLSRLVPVEGIRKHLMGQKGTDTSLKASSVTDSVSSTSDLASPQSLEIEEGCNGVSLKPLSESDVKASSSDAVRKDPEKSGNNEGDGRAWGRMPSLPSYVPFGELYLLGSSSVEYLSDAEYSNLTSCTSDSPAPFLGIDQLQQFPHLLQWLGLSVAGTVELGHIVESPSICTATSIVPLGWTGTPGDKNADPLKVDISGSGLRKCQVQAQVNGKWYDTTVETVSPAPNYSDDQQPELVKMRVHIGGPLKKPPEHQIVPEGLTVFPSIDSESINLKAQQMLGALPSNKFLQPQGLNTFVIFFTNDFTTVSKEVDLRIRRVRFVGLEGAGKTSLLKAILNKGRQSIPIESDNLQQEADVQEGIAGGLCYLDSAGVNLQELSSEAVRLKDEFWMGIRDLSRKIDLLVLVHNLAHQIPKYNDPNVSQRRPALSILLEEAKALGIPWVLAVTNKFSVSAHQQRAAIDAVLKAYQASPTNTEILNSCPYVIHAAGSSYASLSSVVARDDTNRGMVPRGLVLGPLNFVRKPFQRKATILPVEGVDSFCQLVHRELRTKEESSFEEFARDKLLQKLTQDGDKGAGGKRDGEDKANSMSAATIGASLGAGLGVVLAVVMGAASALRKP